MSWTIRIQRSSEYSSYTKYKVTAYREQQDVPSKLSSEFELDRKAIVGDFQRLLPDISGESLRFRSLQKFADLTPLQSIFSIGTRIYSALGVGLKNTIRGAESIHIMTDDLEVPWEIMGEDEELICLKCSCGISPFIKRDKLPPKSEKTRKLKVLFIVDTKDNLQQTRSEVQSITSMMGSNNIKVDYDILEGKKATYNRVRNYILMQNLDIVHVAAHTQFDSNLGNSGVVLNDDLLRPEDVYNDIVTGPPWLVFMNSCESARTMDSRYLEKYGELSGLAIAFLAAGALSYIGTICRINDKAASQIAIGFYEKLLRGSSVGQSMQMQGKNFLITMEMRI